MHDNLTIYASLVLAMCVLTVGQVGVVMLLGLRGSKNMFEAMLGSLVRASMRFFDTNPIGRLLNRCGDDVFQCDIEIPLALSSILLQTASALSKILTSVFVIQWMGLLLPPLVYGYYKLGASSRTANLVNMWVSVETSLIAPERLHENSNLDEEGFKDVFALEALWPTTGHIAFDRVGFQYKVDDPLVLQNVSFTIKGGEKVGVVDRTGVGKSSLTMALFRINELASGTISIDGIDTATLPLRLRRGLAIIPQNPVHFKGTLHTNLDPLDTYSDNQLWAALGKVKLLDRLTTSDAKLEQPVDEKGDNFSVGERQMLCMARALLGQAKILVLERVHGSREPTDEMLQRVIRNEFAGATPLTIAHRLGTILDYDRILVFDHGTLMQNDTPDVLLADTRGAFYELAAEGGNIATTLERTSTVLTFVVLLN
ncbi:hypothetical protein DYB28_008934 [Aphanomyces astaci]|uniref:ABC transporter domain-containing protein n=1 Tax=Aphanomyces astaci TaxID=112090 RepID=A0A9X8HAL2_APHAT|nr:hypothetical protein DYB28_008934 [Aphanomyces astaci]